MKLTKQKLIKIIREAMFYPPSLTTKKYKSRYPTGARIHRIPPGMLALEPDVDDESRDKASEMSAADKESFNQVEMFGTPAVIITTSEFLISL